MTTRDGARAWDQARADEAAQRAHLRRRRGLRLPPRFRDDPIPNQLLDYLDASAGFSSLYVTDLHLVPQALADPSLFDGQPFLPPEFSSSWRAGYQFEFAGECGQRLPMFPELTDLCSSFSYLARPGPGASQHRSYALLSADLRVHYRDDGRDPGGADPAIDDAVPESAESLPGGGRLDLNPDEKEGGVGAARVAVLAVIDWMFGRGGTKQAAADLHESEALRDLRTFSEAVTIFRESFGGGRFYPSPAQLADAATLKAANLPPLLPARFSQPVRQGYRYEFIGEGEAPTGEAGVTMAPQWESFVYVARPEEPGPPGRRSFGLYPDGLIFSATDGRAPTRRDAVVSGRQ